MQRLGSWNQFLKIPNCLKTCSTRFPGAQSASLHPELPWVLKVSSRSSTGFGLCRGRWHARAARSLAHALGKCPFVMDSFKFLIMIWLDYENNVSITKMYFNILNSNAHSACFFFKGILHFHFLMSLKIISKNQVSVSLWLQNFSLLFFWMNKVPIICSLYRNEWKGPPLSPLFPVLWCLTRKIGTSLIATVLRGSKSPQAQKLRSGFLRKCLFWG